jgi:hypothetical protein
MKHRNFFFMMRRIILLFCLLQFSCVIFAQETVYLHFDNSSYYQGDTIWYKAYVVNKCTEKLGSKSKPLYVELLDELGNIVEHQIVRLSDGEGAGQFILNHRFFTGYYEIRAFTKLMCQENSSCFSRVFPIYRKLLPGVKERSIVQYHVDKSMVQRPDSSRKGLLVTICPEGGQLVEGIQSLVAFQIFSPSEGYLNLTGRLVDTEGHDISPVKAVYDGIGSFLITPTHEKDFLVFNDQGKEWRFPLPSTLSSGAVLHIDTRNRYFDVTVITSKNFKSPVLRLSLRRNGTSLSDTPLVLDSLGKFHLRYSTNLLKAGLYNICLCTDSLIIAHRMVFVRPSANFKTTVRFDHSIYFPNQKICCKLTILDTKGQPVRNARFSVSIFDALHSDMMDYGHTFQTDMLLSSGLNGYVNHPGFYLADSTVSRNRLLDNLLIVRGSEGLGRRNIKNGVAPETSLILTGQVRSQLTNRLIPHIKVSVLARNDSVFLAGQTETDSIGIFHLPIDNFNGLLPTVIQTRRDGKNMNKLTRISLYRNEGPPLRSLDYCEIKPSWNIMENNRKVVQREDSVWQDSTIKSGIMLDNVIVKARRLNSSLKETETLERDILGYYDIQQYVNRERDKGKDVVDFYEMLHRLNPNIKTIVRPSDDYNYETKYNATPVFFVVNGKVLASHFFDEDIDAMRYIMLYKDDYSDLSSVVKMSADGNSLHKEDLLNYWSTHRYIDTDQARRDSLPAGPRVICSITMAPNWDAEYASQMAHGIRSTYLQGYNQPQQFHVHSGKDSVNESEQRRTLYWNPFVTTDDNGCITIECRNSSRTAIVGISVEGMCCGQPFSISSLSRQ